MRRSSLEQVLAKLLLLSLTPYLEDVVPLISRDLGVYTSCCQAQQGVAPSWCPCLHSSHQRSVFSDVIENFAIRCELVGTLRSQYNFTQNNVYNSQMSYQEMTNGSHVTKNPSKRPTNPTSIGYWFFHLVQYFSQHSPCAVEYTTITSVFSVPWNYPSRGTSENNCAELSTNDPPNNWLVANMLVWESLLLFCYVVCCGVCIV